MTHEQACRKAAAFYQGLAADGGTRYHERAALIAKAEGESK